MTANGLPLALGDSVVYGIHGIGRVVGHEQTHVAGAQHECVLLDFASGVRVTMPLTAAAGRLRPLVDAPGLASVQAILAGAPVKPTQPWTARMKVNKAKLSGGSTLELAELVRDGARRDGTTKDMPRLSPRERSLYLQARQLLVRELCLAQQVEESEAELWIEAQIPQTNGGAR